MTLHQIAYRSTSSLDLSDEGLRALQEQAVRNNERDGITGFLLYHSGVFIQMIEGREDALRSLIARIMADHRHSEMTILFDHPVPERSVPEWSMGVLHADKVLASGGDTAALERLLSVCVTAPSLDGRARDAFVDLLRETAA